MESFPLGRNRSGSQTRRSYCHDCCTKLSRLYHNKNRNAYNTVNKAWREANPELFKLLVWKYHIKSKYGLTEEQYLRMAGDPPRCGICRCERDKNRRLSVDHCHKSEVVRGILCNLCNQALERLENIPDWASKAREYLANAESK